MTFIEYIKLALRTESNAINYKTGLPCTPEDRLRHAAMGMVTEAAELLDAYKKHIYYGKPLDKVNIKEEIGDICWYLALWCDVVGFKEKCTLGIKQKPDVIFECGVIIQVAAEMLVCRSFATVDEMYHCVEIKAADFEQIMGGVMNICRSLGTRHVGDILENNIAKLWARYPDKFNSDRAINRDLSKERQVLEGNQ